MLTKAWSKEWKQDGGRSETKLHMKRDWDHERIQKFQGLSTETWNIWWYKYNFEETKQIFGWMNSYNSIKYSCLQRTGISKQRTTSRNQWLQTNSESTKVHFESARSFPKQRIIFVIPFTFCIKTILETKIRNKTLESLKQDEPRAMQYKFLFLSP